MKITALAFLVLPFILLLSCNSKEESKEETFTATINEENWEFYDVIVEREAEDLIIQGKGYLNGDRGAIPVNLKMTLVAVPSAEQIQTPFVGYFAPNTRETAVFATIEPEDSQLIFDTKLDPNAIGKFVINEVDDDGISGEFNFIAVDNSGRKLEVTEGKFNGLSLH